MAAQRLDNRFLLPHKDYEPAYLKLHRQGLLKPRVVQALQELTSCAVCPRKCGVNRLKDERAACKSGRYAKVANFFPHFGEEDCLRGWNGSGTIFFSWCNLRCVFCQNFDVSQEGLGQEVSPPELAAMMIDLQMRGCHNINLVTPEHVVPQFLEALPIAVENGLKLPIVYNTSAYDSLRSIQLLDGIVDIYMPDLKMLNEDLSLRYLVARDYPQHARAVIREMHRQVGDLVFDERGLGKRGLIVRHLMMPKMLAETEAVLRFIAEEISKDTYVNIMSQYYPAGKVSTRKYEEINRRLTNQEAQKGRQLAHKFGLWRLDQRQAIV